MIIKLRKSQEFIHMHNLKTAHEIFNMYKLCSLMFLYWLFENKQTCFLFAHKSLIFRKLLKHNLVKTLCIYILLTIKLSKNIFKSLSVEF